MKHTAIIFSGSAKAIFRIKSCFLNLFDDWSKLFGMFNQLPFMTESSLRKLVRRCHVEFDVLFKDVVEMDEFARRFIKDIYGEEYILVENICCLNKSGPQLIKDCQHELVSNLKSGFEQFHHLFEVDGWALRSFTIDWHAWIETKVFFGDFVVVSENVWKFIKQSSGVLQVCIPLFIEMHHGLLGFEESIKTGMQERSVACSFHVSS